MMLSTELASKLAAESCDGQPRPHRRCKGVVLRHPLLALLLCLRPHLSSGARRTPSVHLRYSAIGPTPRADKRNARDAHRGAPTDTGTSLSDSSFPSPLSALRSPLCPLPSALSPLPSPLCPLRSPLSAPLPLLPSPCALLRYVLPHSIPHLHSPLASAFDHLPSPTTVGSLCGISAT